MLRRAALQAHVRAEAAGLAQEESQAAAGDVVATMQQEALKREKSSSESLAIAYVDLYVIDSPAFQEVEALKAERTASDMNCGACPFYCDLIRRHLK